MALTADIPRIVIAGLRGGSGKTTLAIGLIAALRRKGHNLVPFKKGPDYIDAGWLASAAGKPCYNLDPFLIGDDKTLVSSFVAHARMWSTAAKSGLQGKSGVLAVIEGNRGLYDGMDEEGSFSTARLANTIKSPVILIVDCTKATRTIASMVLGVMKFDPSVKLSGVVLNQIAGPRHESVIRKSIERYCGVPVVGAIPKISKGAFPERHMGLTPFQEHPEVESAIESTADMASEFIDLGAVVKAARRAPALTFRQAGQLKHTASGPKIGVIRDSAFQFYYPENFEALEARGARLVEISALTDKRLPDIDALYIGGGFPETHAIALAGNTQFKEDLCGLVEQGLPVYAECGGLMYLGESLTLGGKSYPMTGILPVSFSLGEKPEAHGYTIVEVSANNPFYKKGTVLRGHEFHYSKVSRIGQKGGMAFRMRRGKGISGGRDGMRHKNVFATYTHLHALGAPEWADGMLEAARKFGTSKALKSRSS